MSAVRAGTVRHAGLALPRLPEPVAPASMAGEEAGIAPTGLKPVERLAARILAVVHGAWIATLRWEMTDTARIAMRARGQLPCLAAIWHNRLFLVPQVPRRIFPERPMTVIVSASRDGAWLAELLMASGMRVCRGSTSRRALSATRQLLRAIQAGSNLGITPDGPRGPCYSFTEGLGSLVRLTRSGVMLLGLRYTRAWRLRTWDGFYVPVPFSRILCDARWITPEELPKEAGDAALSAFLRAALLAITHDPERP